MQREMRTVHCGTVMKPVNVHELAQTIDVAISQNYLLRRVNVMGRIVSRQTSIRGHVFFVLADLTENAQISGILFQSRRRLYDEIFKEGDQVVISGNISYYTPNGTIRLLAEQVKPLGQSMYAKQREAIRREMEAKGYFSPARKRELPPYVFSVTLVTSPVGAVVHDVTRRIAERSPFVACRLIPAQVQGEGADESIAAGIVAANESADAPDVIIVARGGGSREELATFDSPIIIEAAVRSEVPIISAIGHESDSPLLDLAADMRAATPTHAAEMVTSGTATMAEALLGRTDALRESLDLRREQALQQLQFLVARGMHRSLDRVLTQEMYRLHDRRAQATTAWNDCWQAFRQALAQRQEALSIVSPETMFRNGYMWVAQHERQITDLSRLTAGDRICLEDRQYTAGAIVTEVHPRKETIHE